MKVLNAINFEIYSTENKKSMKAFKQGCQTIIFACQKKCPCSRVEDDSEGKGQSTRSRAVEATSALTG